MPGGCPSAQQGAKQTAFVVAVCNWSRFASSPRRLSARMLALYALALAAQCVSRAPAALREKDSPSAQCTKWCEVAKADRQCGWCKCQACPHCTGKTAPAEPGLTKPAPKQPQQPQAPAGAAQAKPKGRNRSRPAQQQAAPAAAAHSAHSPPPSPAAAAAEHSPLAAVFVIAFTLALLMLLVQLVCASQSGGDGGGWSALGGDRRDWSVVCHTGLEPQTSTAQIVLLLTRASLASDSPALRPAICPSWTRLRRRKPQGQPRPRRRLRRASVASQDTSAGSRRRRSGGGSSGVRTGRRASRTGPRPSGMPRRPRTPG